jgi:DNA ligase (NAD+)
MMAMGVPLPQASLKALGDMSWQQMRERSAKAGRPCRERGREARQIVTGFMHQRLMCWRWLAEQHINGF